MEVAQHRDHAKLAHCAQVALLSEADGGDVSRGLHLEADVIGQQAMVAAPTLERHAEVRGADGGARQHAVTAPGQAPVEPAQCFVVQFLHRRVGYALHLCSADACVGVFKKFWRNLCQFERVNRTFAILDVSIHNGIDKCNRGCCGGA